MDLFDLDMAIKRFRARDHAQYEHFQELIEATRDACKRNPDIIETAISMIENS